MLEMKNICAGYGKKEILHNLSVSFGKGTLTSVIGTNGCGKSTLLKTMLGLIPCTLGQLSVDGKSLSLMKRTEIAKRIAYLAQGKSLPDMTVEQMVLHGRFPHLSYPRRYTKKDRAIAQAAMERTGIKESAAQPMAALSGGMRQNAYLAMALAQDTDYILLDEPTTYLDIGHQLGLMNMLRQLAETGKGVVAVMHDLPLAFAYSDRIAVMKEGSIVCFGPPDKVCENDMVRQTFGVTVRREGDRYFYDFGFKTSEKCGAAGLLEDKTMADRSKF